MKSGITIFLHLAALIFSIGAQGQQSPPIWDREGIPPENVQRRSEGAKQDLQKLQPRKFDSFTLDGRLPAQSQPERLRFARFAGQLKREPQARGYVITYGGRIVQFKSREAEARAEWAKYRIAELGIKVERIKTIIGGFREEASTELWIVPEGAPAPLPTPTVEANDVAYCPFIRIFGERYLLKHDTPLKFRAHVSDGDSRVQPTFEWKVSQGKITSGQGTHSITVELQAEYKTVHVTVEVGGYSPDCPSRDSFTTAVGVHRFKFDEFGDINCEDELARLDNIAIHLQNEPAFQFHILVYGGRNGPRNEAMARAVRMKSYLIQTRGVDPQRISIVDGGYREELMCELWLSPRGAPAPVATPTVDPQYVRLKGWVRVRASPCSYE